MLKTKGFLSPTSDRHDAAFANNFLDVTRSKMAAGSQLTSLPLPAGLLVLLLAVVWSCAVAELPRETQPRPAVRLLVEPRSGLAIEVLDEILRRHGARRVDSIPQINVHIVEVPSHSDPHVVATELKNRPEIKNAEVDEAVPPSVRSSTPRSQ